MKQINNKNNLKSEYSSVEILNGLREPTTLILSKETIIAHIETCSKNDLASYVSQINNEIVSNKSPMPHEYPLLHLPTDQ